MNQRSNHFLAQPGSSWAFYPELPIAVLVILFSPMWALSLVTNGHVGAGIFLVAAIAPLGYVAYRGIRTNNGWSSYGSVIGILIVCGIVASIT